MTIKFGIIEERNMFLLCLFERYRTTLNIRPYWIYSVSQVTMFISKRFLSHSPCVLFFSQWVWYWILSGFNFRFQSWLSHYVEARVSEDVGRGGLMHSLWCLVVWCCLCAPCIPMQTLYKPKSVELFTFYLIQWCCYSVVLRVRVCIYTRIIDHMHYSFNPIQSNSNQRSDVFT